MEFTYFFDTLDKWNPHTFVVMKEPDFRQSISIPDALLEDRMLSRHGFPFKGTGYVNAIEWREGKTYLSVRIDRKPGFPVNIECDGDMSFVEGGSILFPPVPSYDSREKMLGVMRKKVLKGCSFGYY